jgi:hypothetical protein
VARGVAVLEGQRDPVMARIVEAVGLAQAGHGDAARPRFAEIWEEIGAQGDPLHRCTLAHYAADVQSDVEAELMWDLRALAAADEVTDERAQRYDSSLSVARFYPSLHLNLADVYRRLGDREKAREHVVCAEAALDALEDDGYGRLIREGVVRTAAQLAEEPDCHTVLRSAGTDREPVSLLGSGAAFP